MPRPAKGPRLYLRERRGAAPVWIIRDGAGAVSTGCGAGDRPGAEIALARYITDKHAPARGPRGLGEIPLADVIGLYARDVIPRLATSRASAERAERLLLWWGAMTLADVTGATCRAYAASRPSPGGARRDLQDLAAAIGHHLAEGYHREVVKVPLPPAGKRRERWLTRSEIARLVWAAWTMRSEQRRDYGDPTAARLPTRKRTGRHIARAILLAYYTGSRIGTVLTASIHAGAGRSWIDLDAGLFFRLPAGKTETTKRQPPVRLGARILSHLRRWARTRQIAGHVVEWEGAPVASIKTGFARAASRAGLGADVTPHTLRHSRATHLKRAGVSSWEVAGALGMSEAMVERVYGHHDPHHLERAINAR